MKSNKNYTLSDTDVLELVENKATIVSYKDLHKYKTLDELLGKNQAIFLLYETKPDFGHWTAVIRSGNTVEFFDPYGMFIDEPLKHIPPEFAKESNQDRQYLSYLMYESPYKLTYNEHPFQKLKNGINTCGRWSALRIVFKDMPLKNFESIFKSKNKKSDDVVTEITNVDLM